MSPTSQTSSTTHKEHGVMSAEALQERKTEAAVEIETNDVEPATHLAWDALLDAEPLPAAIDFRDTAFFQRHAALPEPATVQQGRFFGVARFEELGLFVKFGPHYKANVEEAKTLQALSRAFPTRQVPVPELYGWRSLGDINFIYMSLIPGKTLNESWPSLAEQEKAHLANRLAEVTSALGMLTQSSEEAFIGSIGRGRVQDLYFGSDEEAGPFLSAKDFNDRLHFLSVPWIPLSERPPDPYRALLPDSAVSVKFAHADLHPANIIICGPPGSQTIAGLIDWGQSGWYPDYWEYCKMLKGLGNHELYEEGWLQTTLEPRDSEYDAFIYYWMCRVP